MNTDNVVMWVILQNNADWDCFKTPILQEILKTQNPVVEEHCAFLEVMHLFQDAGLRLDGILALDLWDLIVSVLGNTIQTPERLERPVVNDKNRRSQGMTNVFNRIECVPSNVQSSHQEALFYVFEDNEAVIKMIKKGRSPTMRHVSRTHRVVLDWLFDRISLDPKIQIKYIDTKNQLADILTKGNFTRDEWNHMLSLFNISHFSSTVCSETMAKRLQQDSGEERVTAKSRPMMSLLARVPSNVPSSTSVSPEKRSYGNQNPWSTIAEKEEGSGRPDIGSDRKTAFDFYYHEQFVESFSSASYSKWDDDHAWSSQEWKTYTEMCERPGRPDVTSWGATRESQLGFSHEEAHYDGTAQSVVNEVISRERSVRPDADPQSKAWPQQFVIGNAEAELELSVESRSFVNRVNDQETETNFKCYIRWRETFYDLGNVHDCHNGISGIHVRELLEQLSVHCKHERSHIQTNVRHIYKMSV